MLRLTKSIFAAGLIGAAWAGQASAAVTITTARPENVAHLSLWNVAAASGIGATAEFSATPFSGTFGPYGTITTAYTPANPTNATAQIMAGVFVDRAQDGVIRAPDPNGNIRAYTPYLNTSGLGTLLGSEGFFAAPGNTTRGVADSGLVQLAFSQQLTTISLLWGSMDRDTGNAQTTVAGNFLHFYNGNTEVATLTGADVRNQAALQGDPLPGAPALLGPNGTRFVTLSRLPKFDKIIADSNQIAFEFAVASAPLPVVGGGLVSYVLVGLLALAGRFRTNLKALLRGREIAIA